MSDVRVDMNQVFKAVQYANDHPDRYLSGTTNWCAAVAFALNRQIVDAQPSGGALTNEGAEPVAWMLADAVGGSCLEFQKSDLIENQNRYGGEVVPLYRGQPHPVSVILPPAPELPEEPPFADDDSYMDAYNAAHRMRTACAEAIAAAGIGLKLKP